MMGLLQFLGNFFFKVPFLTDFFGLVQSYAFWFLRKEIHVEMLQKNWIVYAFWRFDFLLCSKRAKLSWNADKYYETFRVIFKKHTLHLFLDPSTERAKDLQLNNHAFTGFS